MACAVEHSVYRTGFIIVMVLAIALGLLIGTLNHVTVTVDLLWVQLNWPLGLSLLASLATGLLLGWLLAWLFSILPLRLRLRNFRKSSVGNAAFPDNFSLPGDHLCKFGIY
jgi:uncharacterized integral membrane protein